ncbi:putative disease resistance RPP13-like protein 2 [Fagus crenata]
MCLFLVKVDGAEHADIGAIKQKMVELAYQADDALYRYMVNSKLQHKSEYDIEEDQKRLLNFLLEAYNSVYVKNYFDCRAWVHVSSKSTANEILKVILKLEVQFAKSAESMSTEEACQSLFKHLKERRFLIVFDNVSETNLPGIVKKAFPLFQLWIAEGFIQENFEATAEVYLDELIDRGFIQVLKRRSDGRMKTCKIHDLVLEFIAGKPAEMDLFRIRNCIIKDSNVDALQFMLTCLRSFP